MKQFERAGLPVEIDGRGAAIGHSFGRHVMDSSSLVGGAMSVPSRPLHPALVGGGLKKLFQKRRAESGWTQREWAHAADVTENSLSDYLNGRYPPRLDTLGRLLTAGGWSLLDLARCMEESSEEGQGVVSDDGSARGEEGRDSGEMRAVTSPAAAELDALRETVMLRQIESNLKRIEKLEAELDAVKKDLTARSE